MARGRILAFSIDLLRRLQNTLALPCECVIIARTTGIQTVAMNGNSNT